MGGHTEESSLKVKQMNYYNITMITRECCQVFQENSDFKMFVRWCHRTDIWQLLNTSARILTLHRTSSFLAISNTMFKWLLFLCNHNMIPLYEDKQCHPFMKTNNDTPIRRQCLLYEDNDAPIWRQTMTPLYEDNVCCMKTNNDAPIWRQTISSLYEDKQWNPYKKTDNDTPIWRQCHCYMKTNNVTPI